MGSRQTVEHDAQRQSGMVGWRAKSPWRRLALAGLLLLAAGPALSADITDSAGRTVHVPDHVSRIVPAGPPADVLLYALAPDLLAGLVEPWTADQIATVPEAYRGLGKLPRVTGKLSDVDFTQLSNSRADLVVDYGDVTPDYAHLADTVQDRLKTPYLLLNGRLAQAPDIIRKLGAILGKAERAETLAAASQQALDHLDGLSPASRVKVYYARGVDGLQAVRAGSSLGEAIELAGAQNVAPTGKGAFVTMSIDDVVRLAPQVVVLADPSAATFDSPLRRALPPETKFLVDRGLPYPILEKPPSINRLIGALALAEQLYPKEAEGFSKEAAALEALLFPGAPQNALFVVK